MAAPSTKGPGGFAPVERLVEQPCERCGQECADEVHDEERDAGHLRPVAWFHKGSNEQNVNRQACGAAHEWCDQDGDDAGLVVADRASRHNARDGAGKAGEQGHEALAVETAPLEELVHQEGGTGHVAGFFQQRDKKEQHQYLREEDEKAADAANHTIDHEALQHRGAFQRGTGPVAEPAEQALDAVHQHAGPAIDGLEDDIHHADKDREAPDLVQEDLVDALRFAGLLQRGLALENVVEQRIQKAEAQQRFDGIRLVTVAVELVAGRLDNGLVGGGRAGEALADGTVAVEEQTLQLAVAQGLAALLHELALETAECLLHWLRPTWAGQHGARFDRMFDGFGQLDGALAVLRDGGHHRHPEALLQQLTVDLQTLFFSYVPAVQSDDHRHIQLRGLRSQKKIAAEVFHIDDHDNEVGRDLPFGMSGQNIHRHAFIQRVGTQAVGARQIHQLDFLAEGKFPLPRLLLDGYPGVVAHMLAHPGQYVEQRGLAGVGIADQGDPFCPCRPHLLLKFARLRFPLRRRGANSSGSH